MVHDSIQHQLDGDGAGADGGSVQVKPLVTGSLKVNVDIGRPAVHHVNGAGVVVELEPVPFLLHRLYPGGNGVENV